MPLSSLRPRWAVPVVVLSLLAGCSCGSRHDAWLRQVEENLRDDVRPKYERALRRAWPDRDPLVLEADLEVLDATIRSVRRVRTGAEPAPIAPLPKVIGAGE